MGKSINVAVIDPKTGNPVYDEHNKLVTRAVDPETGDEAKSKKPAATKGAPKNGSKEKGGSG